MLLPPFLPELGPPEVALPPGGVRLPANGTTVAAEELHAALVLAVNHAPAIVIDASAVEHVGQAVLQLLIATRTQAATQGIAFSIADPSPAFRARVSACALCDAIGLEFAA